MTKIYPGGDPKWRWQSWLSYITQNSFPFVSFDKEGIINVFIKKVLPWFSNIHNDIQLISRNKDNRIQFVGRRWAATYIFHLGEIQLPRGGGGGWGLQKQNYGAITWTERTIKQTRAANIHNDIQLISRNKDNRIQFVGRRSAATYIFHLGEIQLPK